MDLSFYKGKKVFITGHTGFKGTWLCKILCDAGAEVVGYSLYPEQEINIFSLSDIESQMCSIIADIRDFETLQKAFTEAKPDIVFHLAAQPIVRRSYKEPVYTYETNVMGTVHVLECIRKHTSVQSFVNVTTDKVYDNIEQTKGYVEEDPLDGYDPYSNSKSCSELVTHSYTRSFFSEGQCSVSTARAGNVIGGGDFAEDRIIPDCIRAAVRKEEIKVRNPYSIRPYQHVLEPLGAYMMIAQKQYEDSSYAGSYNVGPNETDCITTGNLVEMFCQKWGKGQKWVNMADINAPHEASFLKLDCTKIQKKFGWFPKWNVETAVEKIVEWTNVYLNGESVSACMEHQIQEFFYE